MLDRWLDDYEARWQGETAPDLLQFLARSPGAADSPDAARELALIDLEHRWRKSFSVQQPPAASALAGLARLPTWADYCRLLPACELSWVDGICHEFRVRQLFGDRPDYRQVVAQYAAAAGELTRRLPDVAAALTRATIGVIQDCRLTLSCRLPGRVEVGRRRLEEPAAPALIAGEFGRRLLIADLPVAHISRAQCQIEVIAKDRLLIQHKSPKGYVACSTGDKLSKDESCEIAIPCLLNFRGCELRIERAAG